MWFKVNIIKANKENIIFYARKENNIKSTLFKVNNTFAWMNEHSNLSILFYIINLNNYKLILNV